MACSIQGTPVRGKAQGTDMSACLSPAMDNGSPRTVLTVDITVAPELHVYGEPIPEGFIPLSITVEPREGLVVGTPVFPPPTPHRMEGLDDLFYIYQGTISISLPLTFMAAADATPLKVQVRYQACGEMGCYMPQTVELHLPLQRLA